MKKFIIYFVCLSYILLPATSYSREVFTNMRGGAYFNNILLNGQATSFAPGFKIKLFISCFKANLRRVSNPLSPNANVKFQIGINGTDISVVWPARLIHAHPVVPAMRDLLVLSPAGATASGMKGIVSVHLPPIPVTPINGSGDYNINGRTGKIDYLGFIQDTRRAVPPKRPPYLNLKIDSPFKKYGEAIDKNIYSIILKSTDFLFGSGESHAGWGPIDPFADDNDGDRWGWIFGWTNLKYLGQDGRLTAQVSYKWASDLTLLEIWAAFAGQIGFCGSFVSPLILFFDDQRPKYSRQVNFSLSQKIDFTNWPEKNAPGYFLALDKNNNKKIDDGSELFGDQNDGYSNGFEQLREYDKNKDKVIDSKDKIFSQLILWRDVNSNGISERGGKGDKKEMFKLKDLGVQSISLDYEYKKVINLGSRAEFRQRANFHFNRDGTSKVGEIIDVWLSTFQ